MTTIDTARLRALAEAATPGPWTAKTWTPEFHDEMRLGYVEVDESGYELWDTSGGNTVAEARDAEFIAAVDPQTVLALLDERDRLISALGRIHGYVRGAARRVLPEEYAEWERVAALTEGDGDV